MTSFKSKNFPKSKNGLIVMQEHAMQYFGAINLGIMLVVLTIVGSGKFEQTVLWMVIIVEIFALGISNLLAYAKLNRMIANVFFVNQHFSVISVYEILFKKEANHAFPLIYANPNLDIEQNSLSIHFNDQIITLQREDWDEFDLMRDYFYAAQY